MTDVTPETPRVLTLLWGHVEPARRGPRPTLTVEQIARAAIGLADAEGLDAVSMKRVAEACGVSTMALYRYVDTKADLFTVMLEIASGPAPEVPADPWRAGLEAWCRGYRELLVRHPWMLQVPLSGPPETPDQLGWMEASLLAMEGMGLSPQERSQVLLQVNSYVRGDVALNVSLSADSPHSGSGAWALRVQELSTPAAYPLVHAMIDTGTFDEDDDPGEQFEFGLARMLDGIGMLVAERSA
jgi:AcrR family transcriptional regulator